MDGIKKMADKILQDGSDQSKAILEAAEAKILEIEKTNQKKAEAIKHSSNLILKTDSEKLRLTFESNAELEKRNALLKCKQEKIDQVFERAAQSIRELEPSEYIKLLVNLLLVAADSGTEEVVFSAHDKEQVGEKILTEANLALGRLDRENHLKLSDTTAEMIGGFLLKADSYELNYSLEALVKQAREALEPSIVKVLFS